MNTNPAKKVLAQGKAAKKEITLTSQCLSCKKSFTEKIPWFEKKKYICPDCGGQIDFEPVRKLTQSILKSRLENLPKV